MNYLLSFLSLYFGIAQKVTADTATNVEKGKSATEQTKASADPAALYLYDHNKKDSFKVKGNQILPNRVYAKFDADLKRWVLTKTNPQGKFTDPLEALRAGTVVPGPVIGVTHALKKFKMFQLTDTGHWIPSEEKEQYKLWVKGNPPKLVAVTFKIAKAGMAPAAPRPKQ